MSNPIIENEYKTILIHEDIQYHYRSLEHVHSVFDRLGAPSKFHLMVQAGYAVQVSTGKVLKDRYQGVSDNAASTSL